MKIYAYYLPQYHEIPENNKWWGKGFTEWTNVKKAKALFKNHNQPKIPENDNYYSLDNIETMRWQSKIAQEYGIDGMIFYHYYFCGKKLLQKPAEMLLNNDIPLNFFFCWANHSWYKSWEGSKELLMEQKYGNELEWEEHFQYLLPFFKDERYEKKNNMPVMMIYDPHFPEMDCIFSFFNKKCKDNGFDGICVIESHFIYENNKIGNQDHYMVLSASREPNASLYMTKNKNIFRKIKSRLISWCKQTNGNYIEKYDGNKLYKSMIDNARKSKQIKSIFFEWDNTPRHSYRGYIITPPSKTMFMKYMDSIKESEYIFVNAWNEWCEGMILEPTKENGYKYLEWIKEWKNLNC